MRDSCKCDDIIVRELVGTVTDVSAQDMRPYETAWRDKLLRHCSEPRQIVFSRIDEI